MVFADGHTGKLNSAATDNLNNALRIQSGSQKITMFLKSTLGAPLFAAALVCQAEIRMVQPKEMAVYQRGPDNTASVPVIFEEAQAVKSVKFRHGLSGMELCDWAPLEFTIEAGALKSSVILPSGGWREIEFELASKNSGVLALRVNKIGVGEVFCDRRTVQFGKLGLNQAKHTRQEWFRVF